MKNSLRLALGSILSLTPVSAYTVLVDLGRSDRTTSTTGGIHWNNISGGSDTSPGLNNAYRFPEGSGPVSGDLVDTTGAPTGVTLAFSGRTGNSPWGWSTNSNGGLIADNYASILEINGISIEVASATNDYFFSDSTQAASITISGLDAGFTYILSLFASRQETATRITSYTVTDSSGPLPPQTLQTSGSGIGANGYNGNNHQIVTFDNLVPDVNGELVLTVQGQTAQWGYLNVLGITQVPEPGSAMLGGLGGLLLLSRRRRNAR